MMKELLLVIKNCLNAFEYFAQLQKIKYNNNIGLN